MALTTEEALSAFPLDRFRDRGMFILVQTPCFTGNWLDRFVSDGDKAPDASPIVFPWPRSLPSTRGTARPSHFLTDQKGSRR